MEVENYPGSEHNWEEKNGLNSDTVSILLGKKQQSNLKQISYEFHILHGKDGRVNIYTRFKGKEKIEQIKDTEKDYRLTN